jgi:DNA-directed RNA polymerase specialized sigma24 family protein
VTFSIGWRDRVACRLTSNGADAEELLQDTMLKAYSAFGSFVPSWVADIRQAIQALPERLGRALYHAYVEGSPTRTSLGSKTSPWER